LQNIHDFVPLIKTTCKFKIGFYLFLSYKTLFKLVFATKKILKIFPVFQLQKLEVLDFPIFTRLWKELVNLELLENL
jgi:hypothetical protein